MSEKRDAIMQLTVDGGILAGGLARRMDGQNKSLMLFQSRPMIASVADALRPATRMLLINCNSNETALASYCDKTTKDLISGFQGPLAGIHSLLNDSTADYVLISSCDTPLLDVSYATEMLNALTCDAKNEASPPLLYYALSDNKAQPTHILAATSLARGLAQRLQAGQLKTLDWLHANKAKPVTFKDASLFANINTIDDLTKLQSKLR